MHPRHNIGGRFRLACETIVIWLAPCLTPIFHCARKAAINDGGSWTKNPEFDAHDGKADARSCLFSRSTSSFWDELVRMAAHRMKLRLRIEQAFRTARLTRFTGFLFQRFTGLNFVWIGLSASRLSMLHAP
jgi:hypothetical protein